MRAAYRVLAYLVPIIVALQASFIALGTFGLGSWVDKGNDLTKSVLENNSGKVSGSIGFDLHGIGADAMALVALVLLIVSFFAKVEGGVKWAALILVDTILQWALAFASFAVWAVGVLHGLNAFVLAGLGVMAIRAASRPAGRRAGDPVVATSA